MSFGKPWEVVQLSSPRSLATTVVATYKSRNPADDHVKCLQRLTPNSQIKYIVVFNPSGQSESRNQIIQRLQTCLN